MSDAIDFVLETLTQLREFDLQLDQEALLRARRKYINQRAKLVAEHQDRLEIMNEIEVMDMIPSRRIQMEMIAQVARRKIAEKERQHSRAAYVQHPLYGRF